MRKLVLGIIALVSIQFAFVTYTMLLKSSDRLMEDLAMSRPVLTSPNAEVGTPIDIVTDRERSVPSEEPRMHETKSVTPIVPERAAKREASPKIRPSKPAFLPAPPDSVSQGDFENVVIRYHRNPKVSDCDSRDDISKTKKRSYLAKASPVIKKPWDWLKSVGAKLN